MNEREFCIWLSGVFAMRGPRGGFDAGVLDLIDKKLGDVLSPNVIESVTGPHAPDPAPVTRPQLFDPPAEKRPFVADRPASR